MSNLNRTKVRRESTNTMPSALPLGEIAFNSETSELFVGTGTGKAKVTDPKLTESVNQLNSQLNTIETKKANQSSFNNLRNQVNNLVLESGGDSNLEVVQSRVSKGFTYRNLDNRLINFESIISEGKFNIEFFDLINNSINASTGEISNSTNIRITTNSKYNISSLNEIYLRINKLDSNRIIFNSYYYDENESLISSVTNTRTETDSYYEYKINVSTAHYVRFLFKFMDDSEITENDVHANISLYFYNEDRISKINNELNEMCYDNLGNKFDSPSELIKNVSKIVAHNKNLFDKSSNENVNGYINGAAGGIDTSSNYKTSYFIKGLQENEKYIITPRIRKFLAYDKNGTVIVSSYVDANTTNYVFTMDSSWSAIRFTYYVSDEDKIMLSQGEEPQTYVDYGYMFGKNLSFNDYQREEIKEIIGSQGNKLENKILFNFGDSIAAGDGNNGKGYAELFATKYNMICYDFAVGGATLGETASNNITTQVTTALSRGITPDYILIEGGTNDIASYNVPIGQISNDYNINNFDKTTTIGGLEWIISTLKSNFPNAKMAFVSVHRMGSRGYSSQIERQGACVDTCKKWSVPVIDIFNRGNLNTFLGEYHKFTNPTESQPNGDRTHPNELGYTTFYLPLIYETLYFI
jgi:lysophospholipase L1-like esterase